MAPPDNAVSYILGVRRVGYDSNVGSRGFPAIWIGLLRLLIRHRSCDDHVLSLLPVHGCGNLVLRRQLEGVDDPKDLVEVPAGGHGVNQDQLDLLVRPDHEDVPDRLVVGWRALRGIAGSARRKHTPSL